MRIFTLLGIGVIGFALMATVSSAHHSTNNIYHEDQSVEVTGKVVEWRLVNPHPYLVVEVVGEDGVSHNWDLSFGGSAAAPLRRRGFTAETFAIGEVVVAKGNPARAEGVYGLLLRGADNLTREDGTTVP